MFRLNGKPVEGGAAPFDLADRGLTLGDGLFETIAVFSGRPAALDAHLERLCAAAAEIRLPVDRDMLLADVEALAAEAGEGDAVIRLAVTRGAGARGLTIPEGSAPTVVASSSLYPKDALNAPIRLATVSIRRNPTSFASRAKTLSYLDGVLAFDEARRGGADDALMLNVGGRVASTAMANLFAVFGQELATAPVSEGVLPGIVRRIALDAAPAVGLTPTERPIAPDELELADAIFATNSVRLVMPVTAIDGRDIGSRAVVDLMATHVGLACGARRRVVPDKLSGF